MQRVRLKLHKPYTTEIAKKSIGVPEQYAYHENLQNSLSPINNQEVIKEIPEKTNTEYKFINRDVVDLI